MGDEPFLSVDEDPTLGFRLRAHDHGEHLVDRRGENLLCALPDADVFTQSRLLVSQVIPLLATLHGVEVLHAGAVLLRDRLYGLTAASGTGKSSTIAGLLARGAEFFADDILGLELRDGAVLAHPGPGVINLDPEQHASLPPAQRESLGAPIGRSEKLHFAMRPPSDPRPLDGILFLERSATPQTTIEPMDDAAPLLGSAYLPYAVSAERMVRTLDLSARLAHDAKLLRVRIGTSDDAAAVAALLDRTLGS